VKLLKRHIHRRKLEFAALPMFAYLRDASSDPRERLSITPCLAHFTMIFGDIDKYTLRAAPCGEDPFQKILDDHTQDKDHHWAWFLREYERLDFHRKPPFADPLRFMWGKGTAQTRRLSCELATSLIYADPLYKYVVLTALKAHGSVIFANVLKAVSDLRSEAGHASIFQGEFNLGLEPGRQGAGAERALEETINRRELLTAEHERGAALVDKVHAIFGTYILELHRYARHRPSWASKGSALESSSAPSHGALAAARGGVPALDPKRALPPAPLRRLAG
jgi:hypothetical protein